MGPQLEELREALGNAAMSRMLDRRTGDAIEAASGGGEPLSGTHGDGDQVRLHDDARSADLARGLGAVAFTFGRDIFLAADAPDLDSPAGSRLLSHELTHVRQQQASGTTRPRRVSAPGSPAERQAAGSGDSMGAAAPGMPQTVHRELTEEELEEETSFGPAEALGALGSGAEAIATSMPGVMGTLLSSIAPGAGQMVGEALEGEGLSPQAEEETGFGPAEALGALGSGAQTVASATPGVMGTLLSSLAPQESGMSGIARVLEQVGMTGAAPQGGSMGAGSGVAETTRRERSEGSESAGAEQTSTATPIAWDPGIESSLATALAAMQAVPPDAKTAYAAVEDTEARVEAVVAALEEAVTHGPPDLHTTTTWQIIDTYRDRIGMVRLAIGPYAGTNVSIENITAFLRNMLENAGRYADQVGGGGST
jgi:hypothetical protein